MISIVTTYTKTLKIMADTCTKKLSSRKNNDKKEKIFKWKLSFAKHEGGQISRSQQFRDTCAHEGHPFVVINMNYINYECSNHNF